MVEHPISGTLHPPRRGSSAAGPPVVSESSDGLTVDVTIPGGDRFSDLRVVPSTDGIRVEGRKRERARPLAITDQAGDTFVTDIPVPAGFDAARVSARYDRGVLSLRLPRSE